jgi:hypothetical protein
MTNRKPIRIRRRSERCHREQPVPRATGLCGEGQHRDHHPYWVGNGERSSSTRPENLRPNAPRYVAGRSNENSRLQRVEPVQPAVIAESSAFDKHP